MAKKNISEFTLQTSLETEDFIPFWSVSLNKSCRITFQNYLKAVNAQLAADGIVALIDGIYYRLKPDLQGQWSITETIGETLP